MLKRDPQCPLPLAGRGLGVAVSALGPEIGAPTPDPSPRGGGERSE